MARRHDKKGRTRNPDGPYWALPYSTAKDPTFRSLSGSALKVLVELRCRFTVRGDGTNNNGELSLSVQEGADLLGLGKATITRAYKELQAAGFIVMTKQGQWYGRMATEWRVTDQPCKGELATRDWKFGGPKTEVGSGLEHDPP